MTPTPWRMSVVAQAVISLSAPSVFAGANALDAAPSLTMPVLYASGAGESTYATAAENMRKASAKSPDAQLLIAPGTGAHGVELILTGAGSKEAIDGVNAFLAKHAPVS